MQLAREVGERICRYLHTLGLVKAGSKWRARKMERAGMSAPVISTSESTIYNMPIERVVTRFLTWKADRMDRGTIEKSTLM